MRGELGMRMIEPRRRKECEGREGEGGRGKGGRAIVNFSESRNILVVRQSNFCNIQFSLKNRKLASA